MYSKDYSSAANAGAASGAMTSATGPKASGNSTALSQPKTSISQGAVTGQAGGQGPTASASGSASVPATALNKSLESVIRKAAFKGIEPLRRRYTATASSS